MVAPATTPPEAADDWLTPNEAKRLIGCKTARTVRNLFIVGTNTPRGRITLRFKRLGIRLLTRKAWVAEFERRIEQAFADPVPSVVRVESPTKEAERFEREAAAATAKLSRRRGRRSG